MGFVSQRKAHVDPYVDALHTMEPFHYRTHQGNMYTAHYHGNATGNSIAILVCTETTKEVHMIYDLSVKSAGDFYVIESPTAVTVRGTAYTPLNLKRSSTNTASCVVRTGARATYQDGTEVEHHYLPAGTGPRSVGAAFAEHDELILNTGTSYLLHVQSAGTDNVVFNLRWYERTI